MQKHLESIKDAGDGAKLFELANADGKAVNKYSHTYIHKKFLLSTKSKQTEKGFLA